MPAPHGNPLCVNPRCAIRGRHQPDCGIDDCWGCLPRPAADGLRLCQVCTERLGEDIAEAADLYAALGDRLAHPGSAGAGVRTVPGSRQPDQATVEARAGIQATVVMLAKLVSAERGFSLPSRWRVRQQELPTGFIGPPNRYRVRQALTGVADLAAFVGASVEWLAAHPRAGEHAADLHRVARDGRVRGLAYPSGGDRLYIGDCPLLVSDINGENERLCGTRLYQYADQPLIQCEGCGTDETIEQWQLWVVGEAGGVVDAYAAAAALALKWMRPVDPAQIRLWAHRGHVAPLTEPDPQPGRTDASRVRRDGRGRTLYDLAACRAYAEQIWGRPAIRRRAG